MIFKNYSSNWQELTISNAYNLAIGANFINVTHSNALKTLFLFYFHIELTCNLKKTHSTYLFQVLLSIYRFTRKEPYREANFINVTHSNTLKTLFLFYFHVELTCNMKKTHSTYLFQVLLSIYRFTRKEPYREANFIIVTHSNTLKTLFLIHYHVELTCNTKKTHSTYLFQVLLSPIKYLQINKKRAK